MKAPPKRSHTDPIGAKKLASLPNIPHARPDLNKGGSPTVVTYRLSILVESVASHTDIRQFYHAPMFYIPNRVFLLQTATKRCAYI